MALLPLDPVFAHLLISSQERRCVSEVLTVVSLLSSENIFLQPYKDHEKRQAQEVHRRFALPDGDLLTLLNIYIAWCKASVIVLTVIPP